MKHTDFFSKKSAERFHEAQGRDTRVLISITTPEPSKWCASVFTSFCTPAKLYDDTWKDVLRLEFHDKDPSHMNDKEAEQYRLFNQDDAIAILKFLKKHQDDTIYALVHCEAGISRSAAVSKFIAQIYNLSFPDQYLIYNKHVFSTLLRVYGESLYGDGLIAVEDLPGILGDIQ